MKSRLINIILLYSFVGIFILAGAISAQTHERGTWVWSNTDEIIQDFIDADSVSTAWDDFISFCEAPHGDSNDRITNIYMSSYTYMITNPGNMRAFLADMNSRGFKVFVVLADPVFAIPLGIDELTELPIRIDFNAKIDDIMVFQKRGHANERFAGIMLDIEPHLNNDPEVSLNFYNPDHFPLIWQVYMSDLNYCQEKIIAYNLLKNPNDPVMTFSDAVASWYSYPQDWDGDGENEILMNDVLSKVSFYTVQAYRDSASEIANEAGDEIAASASAGKICVVGVETMNLPSSLELTFWDEGHEPLETALDTLYSTPPYNYQDNDGFGGFYIHFYANGNIGEEAYQHLKPVIDDHSPVITITYPNGVQVEGIGFTSDITVTWEAYIHDNDSSKTYDVELAYTWQSQLDNDSSWIVIDTDSNVPASVTQSSSTFNVAGVITTNTDRIIIKAEISYSSGYGDPLTTQDTTNFGIAVNESPNPNVWSNDIYLNYEAYPQGMKVIPGENNVLHAAYYYFHDSGDEIKGVYYARSENGGGNWNEQFLSANSYYYVGQYIKTTYPRRPSISKYDDTIAVAWVENILKDNESDIAERVIVLQINDNDGNPSNWLDNEIYVIYDTSFTYTNVEVHVDSNEDVHLIWEAYYDDSHISQIEYVKYSYNDVAEEWQSSFIETVATGGANDYFLRSPSITSTSHGIHAIWGEYKKTTTSSTPGSTIFEENFNNYPTCNWIAYGANGGTDWLPVGGNPTYYIRMKKDSSTTQCGLAQKTDWNPVKDLTGGYIAFDIRTNLGASIPGVITVQILTDAIEHPNFTRTFTLPPAQFYELPAASAWQTLIFPVSNITYTEGASWAHPNLANVKKVQIFFNYTGSADIEIDNFKAYEAGSVTVHAPEMRIVSKTKSGSWGTEKEIFDQTYLTEQNYGGKDTNLCYPLYYPKITSLGDYVYAAWQFTTLGTPDNDSLDQYSSIYFSKCDVSSTSNNWDTASQLSANGYTPAISVWNNSGTPTVQIVYSADFDEFVPDESHTGNLVYLETVNGGSTWSTPDYIVSGSGTRSGIRRPYWNNSNSGHRAIQFLSYPFIYSDENGVSVITWINGGEDDLGNPTNEAAEFCKIRGTVFLPPPLAPFTDFSDNEGFVIKWSPPNIAYAPTAYKLRRIPDNDESSAHYLNGGNPIYGLSYHDNESISTGTHYRYELAYLVESTVSGWSSGSNAIKTDIYLLLDDFEVDGSGESYTGNLFDPFTADIVGVRTSNDSYSGTHSYKITYTLTEGSGSFIDVVFPTTMDFSGYGSLDMQVKFNPQQGMVERIIVVKLIDSANNEHQVGDPIMLVNDGQWHLHHQFLDQTNKDLNISAIKIMRFVVWNVPGNPLEQGNTSFYVDDIKLNNNPILILSQDSLTRSEPVYQRGFEQGFVINDPNSPVNVIYGNGKVPWYLRIYTESQIENNSSTQYNILKDGLIRYDADNDTFYPDYNLPLKVWCKNFGPPGFYNDAEEIVNPEYALNGYPPITNRYFFRGYDFNGDKKISGLLTPAEGPFIESENDGENFYPFDIDGDGFIEGDTFFDGSPDRYVLNEEPAWIFVPVKKHPTMEMDNDAIVMDPADDITWRVLSDFEKGAGEHTVAMYFAVFFSLNQIETMVNAQTEYGYHNGYGEYKAKIIIDMLFN